MQSKSGFVAPLPNYPIPIPTSLLHFHVHRSHLRYKAISSSCSSSSSSLPDFQTHSKNISFLPHLGPNNSKTEYISYSHVSLHHQFQTPIHTNTTTNQNPETRNQENEGKPQTHIKNPKVIFTNMWWAALKGTLGQRINVEGIVSSASVLIKDRNLALAHATVPDIRYIDWAELRRRGFKGVVFDKDNTITVPYSLRLWTPLESSIQQCKSVFGNNMAVFSNSAGLYEYDHDGSKAGVLEKAIGIKVIRHRLKKPAGTADEIEKHFGCKSSQLIMVGDRPFTDVVYGNRNGFLTILTKPLSLAEEPFIVRQLRKIEVCLVNYWYRRGLKPVCHSLVPDAMQCVKDPPL